MRACHLLFAAALVSALASADAAHAQDPGLAIPATSEASASKQGAVLIYGHYTSGDPSLQDTRFTLTNGDVNPQRVHVFFVDGSSGSAADEYFCLGANQTTSFQMSSVDPGTTGYVVAVAVNGTTGCPIGTEGNALSGMVHVKRADGFRGTLPAVAVSALYSGTIAGCSGASSTASIAFNSVSYNFLPRVVAIENVPSRADGRNTLLVANRLSGNLTTTIAPLGKVFGTLLDDTETKLGWVLPAPSPQLVTQLQNGVPLTAPPLETFIPAGRTGWTKLRIHPNDAPLLGAAFFTGPGGSMNLPAATLSPSGSLTIPVVAPTC